MRGVVAALVCAWGVAKAAEEDEDDGPKDEVVPEMRELRQKLASVKEWQGVWERSISGSLAASTEGGGRWEASAEEKTHGSFLLKRHQRDWNPRRGILSWRGDGEAVGTASASYFIDKYSWVINREEWEASYQGTRSMRDIKFEVWLGGKSRNFSLHPGTFDEKTLPRAKKIGRYLIQDHQTEPVREVKIDESPVERVKTWSLKKTFGGEDAKAQDWAVVAGGSTVLEFTDNEVKWATPFHFVTSNIEGYDGSGTRHRSRLLLFPVHDNLEVEVSIDGYDAWRPKGTIADTKRPGNSLTARATLKNKDGKPADDLPPVRRFIFELKDTSREPGVCLNWPLNAKDNDPDLRLAAAEMSGGELSKEDQKLVVKNVLRDDEQQPYADVQVDSYDFGGRAELRVICELEDGREVVGLLKDEKGAVDIVRLPKTNGPGWVAESWRKKNGVADLPDNDDDEKVEGQEYRGDGFTLYEEYRGFVENGRHMECDPKKKDLFILNRANVYTREGISLLEKLAKIKTHARLRDGTEMNGETRLMNGNHREAPHRVDQHGVILSHYLDWENIQHHDGGVMVPLEGSDQSKAGRPKDTAWCYIVPMHATDAIFAADRLKHYNLDHLSVRQLYAAAVAHELLHAIGADHHGEELKRNMKGVFQSAENPDNPTRKPRFVSEIMGSEQHTLYWEDTQVNIAEERQKIFEQNVANPPPGDEVFSKYYWERKCDLMFYPGALRGTDSGDEACVMRYYFATAYEVKGKKDAYYVMRPGVKMPECILCTSPKGTGGNAASHQPQPRFGDAANGRGNCFSQICPNDAIPPRSIGSKK